MNEEPAASAAFDGAKKLDDGHLPTLLYVLLGRLRIYFSIIEQSLRTEYVLTDSTVSDWLKTLDWLEDSFFPVYQLIHQAIPAFPSFGRQTAQRVGLFKRLFTESRCLLNDRERSPVRKLFGLLKNLRQIRQALECWQDTLRERYPAELARAIGSLPSSCLATPVLAPSALARLLRNLVDAEIKIESLDEIGACMALRRAYFLLYYTALIHPEQWNRELHDRVSELHRKALSTFASGDLAHRRIQARLQKLEKYDLTALHSLSNRVA